MFKAFDKLEIKNSVLKSETFNLFQNNHVNFFVFTFLSFQFKFRN